jgi:proteic killer suppression protein
LDIESITHKALRRFFETGNARGLPSESAGRLAKILTFLTVADSISDLLAPPNYGAHELKGDRSGQWALTVTKNWRMVFKLSADLKIIDLDLEDYH